MFVPSHAFVKAFVNVLQCGKDREIIQLYHPLTSSRPNDRHHRDHPHQTQHINIIIYPHTTQPRWHQIQNQERNIRKYHHIALYHICENINPKTRIGTERQFTSVIPFNSKHFKLNKDGSHYNNGPLSCTGVGLNMSLCSFWVSVHGWTH